jgi:hypothetical protein
MRFFANQSGALFLRCFAKSSGELAEGKDSSQPTQDKTIMRKLATMLLFFARDCG